MKFTELRLRGAYIVELEPLRDERGFFARSFCKREFSALSLGTSVAQCNVSVNEKRGTLRGMHFQRPPMEEAKLVRCVRGAIFDVLIDLRPGSPTFGQWLTVELTGENRKAVYIPEGFAHGFQTLENDTEVHYLMFEFYAPGYSGGIRWDDPAFGIRWPLSEPILSEKDRSYPPYRIESNQ